MLQNLSQLIDQCREDFDNLGSTSDIRLDNADLRQHLVDALQAESQSETVSVTPYSIRFENKDSQTAEIPSSGLWYAHSFWKLSAALQHYGQCLKEIKSKVQESGFSSDDLKQYLNHLPTEQWKTVGEQPVRDSFIDAIDEIGLKPNEKVYFENFLSERDWWFKSARNSDVKSGKTLDRGDALRSSLALASRTIVANSSKLMVLIEAFANNDDLRKAFDPNSIHIAEFDPIESSKTTIAENVIYHGVPGVGKSYKINQLCSAKNSTRVTFHPDTQYSDFVGCLRPHMDGDQVKYNFRPGAFTNALVAASNSDQHHNLIIEELNRASAAAAFGEIFQLLDRDSNGQSEYGVDLTDVDMEEYISQHAPSCLVGGKLRLPANLSIMATMNNSDQAVMPMDAAFKRRWRFEYVPLDFRNSPRGEILLTLHEENSQASIEWKEIAQIINHNLAENRVPEDRLIGPWFLSQEEIRTPEKAKNAFSGKLLRYLWDDVLRHSQHELLFTDVRNFGELYSSFTSDKVVFNESLCDQIRKKAVHVYHQDETGSIREEKYLDNDDHGAR